MLLGLQYTFSNFKANYTIYNVFFFVNEISFVFKITTVTVELKSYFEIKDINSIKSWVCTTMYNLVMADIAAETCR